MVVVILAVYNKSPLPSLPRGLTLNAIVSILAAGSKSSLIFVAGEWIGQLKWIWFQRKQALIDMQIFDNASRGPWGSFILLYRHKGCSLVSLGALITIISLAIDPFMQQLFSYPVRQIPSPQRASVRQGHSSSMPLNWTTGNALQALNAGIWADGSFNITPLCPTGNCKWTELHSMGYCAKCEDATLTAGSAQCDHPAGEGATEETTPMLCNITQPAPLWPIQVSFKLSKHESGRRSMFFPAEATTSIDGLKQYSFAGIKNPLLMIAHIKLETPPRNYSWEPQHEWLEFQVNKLARCALNPCVRTYDVSVSNGTPSVNVVSEDFGEIDYALDGSDRKVPTKRDSIIALDGSDFAANLRSNRSDSICWEPKQPPSTSPNYSYSDFRLCNIMDFKYETDELIGESQVSCDYYADTSDWTCEPLTVQSPTDYPKTVRRLLETGLEPIMHNIAASLTHLAVDGSNKTVYGTALTNETYVLVAWPWIALPLAALVLTIVFFCWTLRANKERGFDGGNYIWKSSALPLLYHGIDEGNEDSDHEGPESGGARGEWAMLDQMEEAAGSRLEQRELDTDLSCYADRVIRLVQPVGEILFMNPDAI
ncbi:hypothetical protein BDW62DRAFT_204092 [Aspergillus aurantiobrunneus]